jgi:isopenicillin N synthase-like dioxygenase
MGTFTLPILDMTDFLAAPASAGGERFVLRLRETCHGVGFCYLVGHGVPAALDAALLAESRAFFALPKSERLALAIANSPHFRGYTVLGDEHTKGVSDWREQLDIGPEEAAGSTSPEDPAWLRLRGPNQWPERLPSLRPAVLAWMRAMDKVGLAILRALALGLGQGGDYFDNAVLPRGDPHLKIIRYPARPDHSVLDQGVGLHHDSGLVSFVLQDEVRGLQVATEAGYVDAAPLPGSYVCNLGEMLQIATSGYLRATAHRVRSPPPGTERLSVAYFFHPRLDYVFEPIELPATLAGEARGGQNADPADPVLKTFGENYLKIRLRSHRDVASAHYADVLSSLAR